jgi:hypothetical protein
MNFENLNLVELNAQEVQEIEGGFLPLLLLGAFRHTYIYFPTSFFNDFTYRKLIENFKKYELNLKT